VRLIQSEAEFDRLAADLKGLDSLSETRELRAQERELQSLLALRCIEHEDRTVLPPTSSPLEVFKVLSGKRELSKAHARRLADRFHLSVEAFI